MSYVLEALRRAALEREQGHVPGLHSQQGYRPPGEDDSDPDDAERPTRGMASWRRQRWLGLLLIAILGVGAMGAFVGTRMTPDMPQAGSRPAQAATHSVSAPTEFSGLSPSLSRPDSTAGATTHLAAPIAQQPAGQQPAPGAPKAARMDFIEPAPLGNAPPPAAAMRKAQNPNEPPTRMGAAPLTAGPLPKHQDLPEAIQREIPRLSIGGAMVSDDAANRIVIINGQVLHEGDAITPDLKLESIRHKSAVLNWRGTRFEWVY